MNIDLIKSIVFKALPIALAFIVGKGWLTQEQSGQVVPLVEQAALFLAAAWTFWRSFQTHKT